MSNIINFITKNKEYSIVIVRVGLSLVLLWFGINQIINPESFLGYVPQWLFQSPSVHLILMATGVFETIIGFLLLIGIYTRIVALIAALHLLSIALSLGYNDVAIRDLGLTAMAVSLIFSGAGELSLDNKVKKE